jgi:hypothetical protein
LIRPRSTRRRPTAEPKSEIHDQSYQKLTNRDKFDPGSGFRARRTKLPTRDERSDEAKNFADRRKVVAPPNLASAARAQALFGAQNAT